MVCTVVLHRHATLCLQQPRLTTLLVVATAESRLSCNYSLALLVDILVGMEAKVHWQEV